MDAITSAGWQLAEPDHGVRTLMVSDGCIERFDAAVAASVPSMDIEFEVELSGEDDGPRTGLRPARR